MYDNPKSKTNAHSLTCDRSIQRKSIDTDKIDNPLPDPGPPSFENEPATQNIPRRQWISEAAYFKAESRAFKPGEELNDWLEAEKDYSEMLIDAYLSVFEEDGGITESNLKQLAKALGIEAPEEIKQKTELVRAIQKTSRQNPCFRSEGNKFCLDENEDCKWKLECKQLIAEWLRK